MNRFLLHLFVGLLFTGGLTAQEFELPSDTSGASERRIKKGIKVEKSADSRLVAEVQYFDRVVDPGGVGQSAEDAGDYDRAIEAFRTAAPYEHYLPNIIRVAWLEFARGDYDAGRRTINSVPDFATRRFSDLSVNGYRAAALAELLRGGGEEENALYYYLLAKFGPTAEAFFQIGLIEMNRGDYLGARRQFARLQERSYPTGHRAMAFVAIGRGILELKYANTASARQFFETAISEADKENAKLPKSLALAQLGRASFLARDYQRAEWELTEALEYQRSIGVATRATEIALGDIYTKTSRPDKAFEIYDRLHAGIGLIAWYYATRRTSEAKRQIDVMTAKTEKLGYVDPLFALYTMSGLIEEAQGQTRRASDMFKKACDINERLRKRTTVPLYVERYGVAAIEPYEGLVRTTAAAGDLASSFANAELTKARMFSRGAANIGRKGLDGLPAVVPAWVNRVTYMFPFMKEESVLDQPIGSQAAGLKSYEEHREDIRNLENAYAEYEAAITSVTVLYPDYGERMYPKQLALRDLHLRAKERLIEFEVTALETRVFVVAPGEPIFSYRIARTREQLLAEVDKYRLYFNGVHSAEELARFDPNLSAGLYDLLLRPALERKNATGKPLVPRDSEVFIIPDEFLGTVPFESLAISAPKDQIMPSGPYGPAPTGVRYVADEYDIAYQRSATSLMAIRRAAWKPSKGLFVLADPVFDESDPRSRAITSGGAKPGAIKTMGLGGKRIGASEEKAVGVDRFAFPRLDQTAKLADALVRKVFAPGEATVLQGEAASERGLRGVDLSAFAYLLFATHGVLDGTLPQIKEPALVLNQVGNEGKDDGFLTAGKVMRLHLNAEVVALTACQTGLGKSVVGEGVMGLGPAFQLAGSKNVLVSLWSVSENSTTMFAERFFRHIKEGAAPRRALRLARADVRRQGYEHPFYWAPFVIYAN